MLFYCVCTVGFVVSNHPYYAHFIITVNRLTLADLKGVASQAASMHTFNNVVGSVATEGLIQSLNQSNSAATPQPRLRPGIKI